MTVDSSMSSGYCSLEEELEDCFFTAKTTFFRNLQSKHPSKVTLIEYKRLAWALRGEEPQWLRRETVLLGKQAKPCVSGVSVQLP